MNFQINGGIIMKVQCVICDKQSFLEDENPLAKRLRNRPIHTFMCDSCSERIRVNTEVRLKNDHFKLYEYEQKDDDF